MKKYLCEILGKEESILLQESQIEKGILWEGYSTTYLIKDTVKNVEEYLKILQMDNEKDEKIEDNLSSILDYNNVEFIYLSDFITDEDIKRYIEEGYLTIYIMGIDTIEDIKELYSYNQEEYYITYEYGEKSYYNIEYKEEVTYVKTIESDVYRSIELYKNNEGEEKYLHNSNYEKVEITELKNFEIENLA